MVAISLSIEGWFGLNWMHWKRLVAEVEQLGFTSLFVSDHLAMQDPPAQDSLELIVALTYLADHSEHVHFGAMGCRRSRFVIPYCWHGRRWRLTI